MKTIEEAILATSKCLQSVGVDNSRLESEFLIAAFFKMSRARLVLKRKDELPINKIEKLRMWVRERQKRKPLAYVIGDQPFRDLNLKVSRAVLIPRPETELLVAQAFRLMDQYNGFITAVDVGTGSGNIAISLSQHPNAAQVFAIDRSPRALSIAQSNHKMNPQGSPIHWVRGNLLSTIITRQIHPELIVANLPYIRTDDMATLEPELHWEPPSALHGGPDGLRFIEPCIKQASSVLKPGGYLLLEIGSKQSQAVLSMLKSHSVWTDSQVYLDLSGLPRIVQSRRKGI